MKKFFGILMAALITGLFVGCQVEPTTYNCVQCGAGYDTEAEALVCVSSDNCPGWSAKILTLEGVTGLNIPSEALGQKTYYISRNTANNTSTYIEKLTYKSIFDIIANSSGLLDAYYQSASGVISAVYNAKCSDYDLTLNNDLLIIEEN